MSAPSRYDSLCHYNPTADHAVVNEELDCGKAARWHGIKFPTPTSEAECYQACEEHLGRMLQMAGVEEFHQFGSGCGLEQSYWLTEGCATEATLLAAGIAWIEAPDQYERPQHPIPGTHVKELDSGRWFKFTEDGLWTETEPLEASRGR